MSLNIEYPKTTSNIFSVDYSQLYLILREDNPDISKYVLSRKSNSSSISNTERVFDVRDLLDKKAYFNLNLEKGSNNFEIKTFNSSGVLLSTLDNLSIIYRDVSSFFEGLTPPTGIDIVEYGSNFSISWEIEDGSSIDSFEVLISSDPTLKENSFDTVASLDFTDGVGIVKDILDEEPTREIVEDEFFNEVRRYRQVKYFQFKTDIDFPDVEVDYYVVVVSVKRALSGGENIFFYSRWSEVSKVSSFSIPNSFRKLPVKSRKDYVTEYIDFLNTNLSSGMRAVDVFPSSAIVEFFINPMSFFYGRIETIQQFKDIAYNLEALINFDDPDGTEVSSDPSVGQKSIYANALGVSPNVFQTYIDFFFDWHGSNRLIYRSGARRGYGTAIAFWTDVPGSDIQLSQEDLIKAPKELTGKTFDVFYRLNEDKTISVDDLSSYWNASTQRYEVLVMVTAESAGTNYNIDANSLSGSTGDYPVPVNFDNSLPISNGRDRESNSDLAKKIIKSYQGNEKGSEFWFLKEVYKYADVLSTQIIGAGNLSMYRDWSPVIRESVFGKVDIYIESNTSSSLTETYALYDEMELEFYFTEDGALRPSISAYSDIQLFKSVSQIYSIDRRSFYTVENPYNEEGDDYFDALYSLLDDRIIKLNFDSTIRDGSGVAVSNPNYDLGWAPYEKCTVRFSIWDDIRVAFLRTPPVLYISKPVTLSYIEDGQEEFLELTGEDVSLINYSPPWLEGGSVYANDVVVFRVYSTITINPDSYSSLNEEFQVGDIITGNISGATAEIYRRVNETTFRVHLLTDDDFEIIEGSPLPEYAEICNNGSITVELVSWTRNEMPGYSTYEETLLISKVSGVPLTYSGVVLSSLEVSTTGANPTVLSSEISIEVIDDKCFISIDPSFTANEIEVTASYSFVPNASITYLYDNLVTQVQDSLVSELTVSRRNLLVKRSSDIFTRFTFDVELSDPGRRVDIDREIGRNLAALEGSLMISDVLVQSKFSSAVDVVHGVRSVKLPLRKVEFFDSFLDYKEVRDLIFVYNNGTIGDLDSDPLIYSVKDSDIGLQMSDVNINVDWIPFLWANKKLVYQHHNGQLNDHANYLIISSFRYSLDPDLGDISYIDAIVLYNPTTEPVNLAGFKLEISDFEEEYDDPITEENSINPNTGSWRTVIIFEEKVIPGRSYVLLSSEDVISDENNPAYSFSTDVLFSRINFQNAYYKADGSTYFTTNGLRLAAIDGSISDTILFGANTAVDNFYGFEDDRGIVEDVFITNSNDSWLVRRDIKERVVAKLTLSSISDWYGQAYKTGDVVNDFIESNNNVGRVRNSASETERSYLYILLRDLLVEGGFTVCFTLLNAQVYYKPFEGSSSDRVAIGYKLADTDIDFGESLSFDLQKIRIGDVIISYKS